MARRRSTALATAGAAGMPLRQFHARHDRTKLAAATDGHRRVSRAEFLAAAGGMAKAGNGDPAKRSARLDRDGIVTRQERAAAQDTGGKADAQG